MICENSLRNPWDWQGNTLEFLLRPTRDADAAKGFFAKTLAAPHPTTPRVIPVDTNAASPKAKSELQAEGAIADTCELTSASSP
jgi:IS6 family transposase